MSNCTSFDFVAYRYRQRINDLAGDLEEDVNDSSDDKSVPDESTFGFRAPAGGLQSGHKRKQCEAISPSAKDQEQQTKSSQGETNVTRKSSLPSSRGSGEKNSRLPAARPLTQNPKQQPRTSITKSVDNGNERVRAQQDVVQISSGSSGTSGNDSDGEDLATYGERQLAQLVNGRRESRQAPRQAQPHVSTIPGCGDDRAPANIPSNAAAGAQNNSTGNPATIARPPIVPHAPGSVTTHRPGATHQSQLAQTQPNNPPFRSLDPNTRCRIFVNVPNAKVSHIIGRSGSNILAVRNHTGADLMIHTDEPPMRSSQSDVIIAGTIVQCRDAENAVRALAMDYSISDALRFRLILYDRPVFAATRKELEEGQRAFVERHNLF